MNIQEKSNLCFEPSSEKRIRAVLHQLCEREAAADLHRADAEGRAGKNFPRVRSPSAASVDAVSSSHSAGFWCLSAGGVRAGGHQVDSDRILQQQDCL